MSEHDIIIVGGGIVGLSFALALRGSGARVAMVEAKPPTPAPAEAFDNRVYAVSPSNVAFLRGLGVWDGLDATRLTPIRAMEVFGDDDSQIGFDADQAGLAELAVIVESSRLTGVLWQALRNEREIAVYCPAQCAALAIENGQVRLTLADGAVLAGQLIVGADGADSWVREQTGIAVREKDYRQLGVVANFACALPHRQRAFQWFRADGVLAWLPLPGERISMVWSTDADHARALMELGGAQFAQAVQEAGNETLGELRLISPVAGFPLRLMRVASSVQYGVALIGDAAHAIHPLAGQGVNLGLGDALQLARTLAARKPPEGFGDLALLRRYERARKEATLDMVWTTDGLARLFASQASVVRALRNFGLDLTNRQNWIKKRLIRHAIG
jgi:2-polyprenylphenol 6-hydroxylase